MGIQLFSPMCPLAAAEVVLGQIIEVSFIATFNHRYAGK